MSIGKRRQNLHAGPGDVNFGAEVAEVRDEIPATRPPGRFGDAACPDQFRRERAASTHGRRLHAEGHAVAGHQAADLAVAPDAQRLAGQHHADGEIGRHRRRLQPALLPGAVLEVADVLRQPPHRGHHQRPGQLGRRHRRAHAFGHRDAQPRAGLDVDVRADAPGLRDELEPGQLLQQRAREVRAFADQHQHVGVAQAHRELTDALDRVGEDLGVVGLQPRGALAACARRPGSRRG